MEYLADCVFDLMGFFIDNVLFDVREKNNISTFFGIYFVFVSIASAWLPGVLLLTGKL
ncbi:hypothetical protein [Legionella tunisiensis]|uniref:hypothetical protein n=1 Tax=Legionella tunisiensis TaxID=1034944 RepID=UPI0012EAC78A|nr:hypothetical protein [Legionella tunisiensis]